MLPARKKKVRKAVSVIPKGRSGEHAISLDEQIRRRFERAFENELQTTAQVSRFVLEDMLAKPEARPTDAPEPAATEAATEVATENESGVAVGTLPPPAIEIHRAS